GTRGPRESTPRLRRARMPPSPPRRYVAPNVLAVAAGNFDWGRFVDLVAKACAGWESGPVGREHVRPAAGTRRPHLVPKDKVAQEHVVLMTPGPAADDPLRYAAETLALAGGHDSGRRLDWALVDPGLAESADTSFHEYEGTGSFYTMYSCDPDRAAENLEVVTGILRDVQRKGITAEELNQAKSKIGSRVVRGSERPMGRMQ